MLNYWNQNFRRYC